MFLYSTNLIQNTGFTTNQSVKKILDEKHLVKEKKKKNPTNNYRFNVFGYLLDACGSPNVTECLFGIITYELLSRLLTFFNTMFFCLVPCFFLCIAILSDWVKIAKDPKIAAKIIPEKFAKYISHTDIIISIARLVFFAIFATIATVIIQKKIATGLMNKRKKAAKLIDQSLEEQQQIVVENIDPRFVNDENIIKDFYLNLIEINAYISKNFSFYLIKFLPSILSALIILLISNKINFSSLVKGYFSQLIKIDSARKKGMILDTFLQITSLNKVWDIGVQYYNFYQIIAKFFQIIPFLMHVFYFVKTTYYQNNSGQGVSKQNFTNVLDTILVIKTCDLSSAFDKYIHKVAKKEFALKKTNFLFDILTIGIVIFLALLFVLFVIAKKIKKTDDSFNFDALEIIQNQIDNKSYKDIASACVSVLQIIGEVCVYLNKKGPLLALLVASIQFYFLINSLCFLLTDLKIISEKIGFLMQFQLVNNPGKPFLGDVDYIEIDWGTEIGYYETVLKIKEFDAEKKANTENTISYSEKDLLPDFTTDQKKQDLENYYIEFMKKKIELSNLKRIQNQNRESNSFILSNGKIFFLVGDSGTGKSTFVKSLMKLSIILKGSESLFDGITHHPIIDLRRKDLSRLFGNCQQKLIFPDDSTLYSFMKTLAPQASEEEMKKCLSDVKMDDLLKDNNGNLKFKIGSGAAKISGGQAARLYIAANLLKSRNSSFFFLILDETLDALNEDVKKEVIELVAQLVAEKKLGIICISHTTPMLLDFIKNSKKLKTDFYNDVFVLKVTDGILYRMTPNDFLANLNLESSLEAKDSLPDVLQQNIFFEEKFELEPLLKSMFYDNFDVDADFGDRLSSTNKTGIKARKINRNKDNSKGKTTDMTKKAEEDNIIPATNKEITKVPKTNKGDIELIVMPEKPDKKTAEALQRYFWETLRNMDQEKKNIFRFANIRANEEVGAEA